MDKLLCRKNCKTCVNATCIEGKRCVVHVFKVSLGGPHWCCVREELFDGTAARWSQYEGPEGLES